MRKDDETTQLFEITEDRLYWIEPVNSPIGSGQFTGDIAIREGTYTDVGPSIGSRVTNAWFTSAVNVSWCAYAASVNGEFVRLNVSNLSGDAQKVMINVMDMFGKQVHSEQLSSKGETFTYELRFDQNLPAGCI